MFFEDDADPHGVHSRLFQRNARVCACALQGFIVVVFLPSLGTRRPMLDVNNERILTDHREIIILSLSRRRQTPESADQDVERDYDKVGDA